MIDKVTGSIRLSETCQLHAGDALPDVSTFPPGEVQQVVDHRNGWQWLTLKNMVVDGQYVIISLGYYANALQQVELIVSQDRFDLTAGWDSWSEQDELDIRTALRVWLRNELGREVQFSWGTHGLITTPKAVTVPSAFGTDDTCQVSPSTQAFTAEKLPVTEALRLTACPSFVSTFNSMVQSTKPGYFRITSKTVELSSQRTSQADQPSALSENRQTLSRISDGWSIQWLIRTS